MLKSKRQIAEGLNGGDYADIIPFFQQGLELEYEDSFFLYQCTYNVSGVLAYKEYHEYFKDGFHDEFKHMQLFSKKLQAFGKDVKIPQIEIPVFATVEDMLAHRYALEVISIASYSRAASFADQRGYAQFEEFFSDLCLQEEGHREGIVKRLGYVPDLKGE